MKKLLFYTDTPNVGGAEKQMLLLAKHLKQKGYSVNLAYGKYSRLRDMHAEFANHCDSIFVLNTLHKHDPRHYWQLGEILRGACPETSRRAQNDNKGFDLIHLHLWNPGACRYAFFAASHANVPIVTTEHDPFELTGLKRRVKLACLCRTAHTIAISEENKKDLQTWYGIPDDKISLVHNGIEFERFLCHSRENGNLLRSRLMGIDSPIESGNDKGKNEDDIIITCVAELHERKGHKYLFEAFNRLQKTIPSLRLMLVGRGPLENELKAKYGANPRIHFLGWRNDVSKILRASDLFVLPSLKEAFGLSVLEAMASGVAVVATASGGIKDIIENGKSGLLVPPCNAERLTEAISTLLYNPDQKRDLEEAAKKRALEFSTARMARETMEVYEKVNRKQDTENS